jgi:hypothetical protein
MYVTLAEFKAANNIPPDDVSHDVEIQMALDAAAEAVNNACNRREGFLAPADATAKSYGGTGREYVYCEEFAEVSLVEVRRYGVYAALAPDDWMAFAGDALDPLYDDPPYAGILLLSDVFPSADRQPQIRITARWGYALSVPHVIKMATIAQAGRWYKRAETAWSDTTASETTGEKSYRQAVDPDIKHMLVNGRLVRPAI